MLTAKNVLSKIQEPNTSIKCNFFDMPQKKITYESKIEQLPSNKIYLNINKMEKGEYELNIINQNKLIKKTTFKKK